MTVYSGHDTGDFGSMEAGIGAREEAYPYSKKPPEILVSKPDIPGVFSS